ncbi:MULTISPECIES: hypothetical protein [Amycolatopsis]|uniref:hypothetical protein n=1 Tax=Amycolatopsis TaxID=1813 RepID=UPI0007E020BE|nr:MULTISPECIES: hypothetical protein [Amycolatopsis]OAP26382.1 hypothetical protein A4R44_02369 [Amycolatopsis sp. M39]
MARLAGKPGTWLSVAVAVALAAVALVVLDGRPPPDGKPLPSAAPPSRDAAWMHRLAPGEKPPQFVLFSFDGAGSHEHWRRVLPLAKSVHAHFSGFLSGIYLLPDSQRDRYAGPGHRPGKASIGFGGSEDDVRTLVADLNTAVDQGEEIGTHYNGHFCTGSEPSADAGTRPHGTTSCGSSSLSSTPHAPGAACASTRRRSRAAAPRAWRAIGPRRSRRCARRGCATTPASPRTG